MMKALLAAGTVLAAATAANADYTINLGTNTLTGGASVTVTTANLTGTLTGFSVQWGYSGSAGASYSSDGSVVINGLLWQGQDGGTNVTFGGVFQANWGPNIHRSTANQQYEFDTQTLAGPIVFNGTSGATVLFGNGYSGGTGTWSNATIKLIGVVPAPGALALLGFAGIVARRRRA